MQNGGEKSKVKIQKSNVQVKSEKFFNFNF
jgi:hypothetical protein